MTEKEVVAFFIERIQRNAQSLDPETMPHNLARLAQVDDVVAALAAWGAGPNTMRRPTEKLNG